MLGLIDGEIFIDAVFVGRVIEVPAGFQLFQSDCVRAIAIDLVRRHVDERRFRTGLASGFEQVEGADCVGVEVIERDGGSPVVGRLGRGVDNGVRFEVSE